MHTIPQIATPPKAQHVGLSPIKMLQMKQGSSQGQQMISQSFSVFTALDDTIMKAIGLCTTHQRVPLQHSAELDPSSSTSQRTGT